MLEIEEKTSRITIPSIFVVYSRRSVFKNAQQRLPQQQQQ